MAVSEASVTDVPALFINSWYDFGTDMTLVELDHFTRRSASRNARENQFAILSPHTHCAFSREAAEHTRVGERDVGDTRYDYRQTYLTWFDAWLKADERARAAIRKWPKLRYYAMGRNRWQESSAWPVPEAKPLNLYLSSDGRANSLHGDGRLMREPVPMSAAAMDRYTYDPANPVPSRGGPTCSGRAMSAGHVPGPSPR